MNFSNRDPLTNNYYHIRFLCLLISPKLKYEHLHLTKMRIDRATQVLKCVESIATHWWSRGGRDCLVRILHQQVPTLPDDVIRRSFNNLAILLRIFGSSKITLGIDSVPLLHSWSKSFHVGEAVPGSFGEILWVPEATWGHT